MSLLPSFLALSSLTPIACYARPNSEESGPEVLPSFNETWSAMEELAHKGLVRSIGVSNFSPEKVQMLMETAVIRPAVNQVRGCADDVRTQSGHRLTVLEAHVYALATCVSVCAARHLYVQ